MVDDLGNVSAITGQDEVGDAPTMTAGEAPREPNGADLAERLSRRAVENVDAPVQREVENFIRTQNENTALLSMDQNPDSVGKRLEASYVTGMAASAFDDKTAAALLDKRDAAQEFAQFSRDYPDVVNTLYDNLDNAAIARGDLSLLGEAGDAWRGVMRGARNISINAQAGLEQNRTASLLQTYNEKEMWGGGLTDDEIRSRDALRNNAVPSTPDYMGQMVRGAFGSAPDMISSMSKGAQAFLAVEALGAAGGAAVGGLSTGGIGAPAGAVVGAKVAYPAAMLAGKVAYTMDTYRTIQSDAWGYFSQLKDESGHPLDRDIALAATVLSASAETAVEYGLTTFALGKVLPKEMLAATGVGQWASREFVRQQLMKPTVRRVMKQMFADYLMGVGAEGVEEFVQNLLRSGATVAAEAAGEAVSDEGYQAPALSINRLQSALGEATQAWAIGTGSAALMIAPTTGLNLAFVGSRVEASQRKAEMMMKATQQVAGSNLMNRSRGWLVEHFNKRTDGSPMMLSPTVIPYLQGKGVDPAEVLYQLGAKPQDIQNAVVTGSDIPVDRGRVLLQSAEEQGKPVEGQAAPVASENLTPDQLGILAHARASANDLTMFEATNLDLDSLREKYNEQISDLAPFVQETLRNAMSSDAIYDDVVDMMSSQLNDSGKRVFSDEEVKVNAQFVREIYRVQATREGIDPMELWRREKFQLESISYKEFKERQRKESQQASQITYTAESAAQEFAQRQGYAGVNHSAFVWALQQGKSKEEAVSIADGVVTEGVEQVAAPAKLYPILDNGVLRVLENDPRSYTYDQPVHHGSPYRFEKFSLDRIGTGEGAQAYGWGLYFAGRKAVAEWYRQKLSKRTRGVPAFSTVDGKRLNRKLLNELVWDAEGRTRDDALSWLLLSSTAVQKSLLSGDTKLSDLIESRIAKQREIVESATLLASKFDESPPVASTYTSDDYRKAAEQAQKYISELEALLSRVGFSERKAAPEAGQLYEVEIPSDDTMLDWDKPFESQPPSVQQALLSMDVGGDYFKQWLQTDSPTGRDIYEQIGQALVPNSGSKAYQKPASLYLRSIGISGNKYLDGSSRGRGAGSYNYVVFDDADVEITKTFYQDNLLTADTMPTEPNELYRHLVANSVISTTVRKQETIASPVSVVSDEFDAARALQYLQDEPQEHLVALVLDKNNKILNIVQHRLGSGDAATTGWEGIIVGNVLNTKNAKRVYIAHNHPSGLSEPSQADHMFDARLRDMFKAFPQIAYRGHIVVGVDNASHITSSGGVTSLGTTRTSNVAKKVNVMRRVIEKRGESVWPALTNPSDARDLANAIGRDGIILLDTQHRPVGFIEALAENMLNLRTQNNELLQRVVRSVDVTNAAAAIIVSNNGGVTAIDNMTKAMNAFQIRVLDGLYRDEISEGRVPYNSMAEKGSLRMMGDGGEFFQPDIVRHVGNRSQDAKAERYFGAPIVAAEDLVTGQEAVIKTAHAAPRGLKGGEIDLSELREGALFTSTSFKILRSYLHDAVASAKKLLAKAAPDVQRVDTLVAAQHYLKSKGMAHEVRRGSIRPEVNTSLYSFLRIADTYPHLQVSKADKIELKKIVEGGFADVGMLQAFELGGRIQKRLQWLNNHIEGAGGRDANPPDVLQSAIKEERDLFDLYQQLDDVLRRAVGGSWLSDAGIYDQLPSPEAAPREWSTQIPALVRAGTHTLTDDDAVSLSLLWSQAREILGSPQGMTRYFGERALPDFDSNHLVTTKGGKVTRVGTTAYDVVQHANTLIMGGKPVTEKNVILPLYAHVKNPMVFDAGGSNWNSLVYEREFVAPRTGDALQAGTNIVAEARRRLAPRKNAADQFIFKFDDFDGRNTNGLEMRVGTGNVAAYGIHLPTGVMLREHNGFSLLFSVEQRDEILVSVQVREVGGYKSLMSLRLTGVTALDSTTAVLDALNEQLPPLVEEFGLVARVTMNTRAMAKMAQDAGHDSVIIKNVLDYGGSTDIRNMTPETVVVLLPEAFPRVKLADANFDGEVSEQRTLYQGYSPEEQADAQALLDRVVSASNYSERKTLLSLFHQRYAALGRREALPQQVLDKAAKRRRDLATIDGAGSVLSLVNDAAVARLTERSARKLIGLFSEEMSQQTAALALLGIAKRGWYVKTALGILDVFGINHAPRFAALLAALSPQVTVQVDLKNALHVYDRWLDLTPEEQRDPDIVAGMIDGDATLNTQAGYTAWRENTITALTTENPVQDMLSGTKVDNFQQAVLGWIERSVIDTWSGRVLNVHNENLGGETSMSPAYLAGTTIMQRAAQILTEATGDVWTVAEVQETSWSYVKALWELSDLNIAEGRSFTQLALESGLITDAMVSEVPDIELEMGKLLNGDGGGIAALMQKLGDNEDHINAVRQRIAAAGRVGAAENLAATSGATEIRESVSRFDYRSNVSRALARLQHIKDANAKLNRGILLATGVSANVDGTLPREQHAEMLRQLGEKLTALDGVTDAKLGIGTGIYNHYKEDAAVGDVVTSLSSIRDRKALGILQEVFTFARDAQQIHAFVTVDLDSARKKIKDRASRVEQGVSNLTAYPALRVQMPLGTTQAQANLIADYISSTDIGLGLGATVREEDDGSFSITAISVPDIALWYAPELADTEYAALLAAKTPAEKDAAAKAWRSAERNRIESWVLTNIQHQIEGYQRLDLDVVVADHNSYSRYIADENGNRNLDARLDSKFGDHIADKIQRAARRAEIERQRSDLQLSDDGASQPLRSASGEAVAFQDTDGTPRGAITINNAGRRISMFGKKNKSTFVHEIGHLWFDMLGKRASMPNAPADMRSDLREILDWLGAESYQTITVDQHERFADATLNNFARNAAPSKGIERVFRAYRKWLSSLFAQGLIQHIDVPENIRAVLSRMVALQPEIDAYQRQENLYRAMVDISADIYSDDGERKKYLDLVAASALEIEYNVAEMINEDIERVENEMWKRAEKVLREKTRKKLEDTSRSYRAMFALSMEPQGDGHEVYRLDLDSLESRADAGSVTPVQTLVDLGYASDDDTQYVLLSPADAAMLLGYDEEVGEMLKDLTLGKAEDMVERIVAARMAEKFATLADRHSPAAKAAVLSAVHNSSVTEQLEMEADLLSRRAKPTRITQEVPTAYLKEVGKDSIRNMPRKAIKPEVFAAAESNASTMAQAMLMKDDYDAALMYKRLQIFEHARYREAVATQKAFGKLDNKIARVAADKKVRARIGKAGEGYLHQIDRLLARFGLNKYAAPDTGVVLKEFVDEEARDLGYVMPVGEFSGSTATGMRSTLTVAQMQDLANTLVALEHGARTKVAGVKLSKAIAMAELAQELAETAYTNIPVKQASDSWSKTPSEKKENQVRKFFAAHMRMEWVFRRLDGFQNQGAWWKAFYEPFVVAAADEMQLNEAIAKSLEQIFFTRFSHTEMAHRRMERVAIPEFNNIRFTREELMTMLFNMGNAENEQRLLATFATDHDTMMKVLSRELTVQEAEIANEVWAMLDDTLWDRVAEVQKFLTGVAPEKVAAAPFTFTANDGTQVVMRGGYYPIRYDSDKSDRAYEFNEQEAHRMLENNFAKAMTQDGHRQKRQQQVKNMALQLGLGVLEYHLANAAHDVTHTIPLVDAYRLARNANVKKAIDDTLGIEVRHMLVPWLQGIANDSRQPQNPVEALLTGYVKAGVTTALMGYKVTTAMVQPLGYTVSVDYLRRNGKHGTAYAAKALSVLSPSQIKEAYEVMTDMSVEMRNRRESFDRDVRDMLKGQDLGGVSKALKKNMMYLTAMTDLGVSMVTWHAAFRQAINGDANNIEAGDQMAAVEYADAAVRMTQGTGMAKDLSQMQRGGGLSQLMTTFYSYWGTIHQVMGERSAQVRAAGLAGVPDFVSSMMLTWFLPAVLEQMLRDAFRDEDDDTEEQEERRLKRLAINAATYPMQGLVGVRDVVQFLANKSAGTYAAYNISPAEEAVRSLWFPVDAAMRALDPERELTRGNVEGIAKFAGYWFHLPTSQAFATTEYLYDLMRGNETADDPSRVFGGVLGLIPRDDRKRGD